MKRKFQKEQTVGVFEILEDLGREPGTNSRLYVCKCSLCGGNTTLRSSQVRRYKSCGCISATSFGPKSSKWKGHGEISGAFWYGVKQGAEKRKLEFSISIEEAWDIYLRQNGRCALSGVEIKFPKSRRDHDGKTASLDRIDNSLGYISGNVQWIHKTVNELKSSFTVSDLLYWCKKIASKDRPVFVRPTWDEYFLGMAFFAASRSRDAETQHGAVIVDKHNVILATGYNSLIAGLKDEDWPKTRPEKYQFMVHAEENAMLNSSVRLRGLDATLYVTGKPCLTCIQRIIQAGIKRVVYAKRQGTKLETVETADHFDRLVVESGISVEVHPYDLTWATEFISRF